MKPTSELRRESNDGQSDDRLSHWLFNSDNLLEGRPVYAFHAPAHNVPAAEAVSR